MAESCRILGTVFFAILSFAVCGTAHANYRNYGDFVVAPDVHFLGVQEDVRTGFIYWNPPSPVASGISFPNNNFDYFASEPVQGYSELIFRVQSISGVRAIMLQASGVYSTSGGSNETTVFADVASVLEFEIHEVNGVPYQYFLHSGVSKSSSLSSQGESHIDVPWSIDLFIDLDAALDPGQHVTSATIIAQHQGYLRNGALGAASIRTDSVQITAFRVPEPMPIAMCCASSGFSLGLLRRSHRPRAN